MYTTLMQGTRHSFQNLINIDRN